MTSDESGEAALKPTRGGVLDIVAGVLGGLAVLTALIRMIVIVSRGTVTQYADYWMMVPTIFRSDGWPSVHGLFELRNEHPIAGAKLLYWLNYKLSGGSNIVLGYLVVAIVVAQVVMIVRLVRRHESMPVWVQAAIVATFGALAFSRHGGWNYSNAMSGAAWLSASGLVIAAVLVEGSRRRTPSLVFGVLASFTYGTGLLVWPALIVTGWARDRRLRNHWRPAVVGAVVYVLYGFMRSGGSEASSEDAPIRILLRNAGETLGSVLGGTNRTADLLVAAAVVIIGSAAAFVVVRDHDPRAAPWLGLYTWGLACTAVVASGRNVVIANFTASRYFSIGLVTVTATIALAALAAPRIHRRIALAVPAAAIAVVLAAWLGGSAVYEDVIYGRSNSDLLAIALRVDAAHGGNRWTYLEDMPPIEGLLAKIGHYPYDGRLTFGCDRIGTKLDSDEVENELPDPGMAVQRVTPAGGVNVPNGRVIVGRSAEEPDCIVVTDSGRNVIGAGVWTEADARGKTGTIHVGAIAPTGADQYRTYIRFDPSGPFYRIPDILKYAAAK